MEKYEEVLRELLNQKNFNVGGGVACAYAGSMASAILGMTCLLSRKKDYGLSKEVHEELAWELDEIKQSLLDGLVKDTEEFSKSNNLMKLSKDTEEKRAKRDQALSDAAISATWVPMENARKCRRVYDISCQIEGKSNPALDPDIMIGKALAEIGTKGCLENVKANMALIRNDNQLSMLDKAIKETEIS